MAYSDFTLAQLKSNFQLTIDEDTNLFADTREADLPAVLVNTLAPLSFPGSECKYR